MTEPAVEAPATPDPQTWRAWGIDPAWSRTVSVPGIDGTHRWHLLDTGSPAPGGRTIVCVHGNPTWAAAWTPLLTRLAPAHRVIAIDQLGMGYSDRVPSRRYRQRIDDLAALLESPEFWNGERADEIVLVAHDWGGAIAMGWAVDHVDQVGALALCNTGIAVPEGRSAPSLIRLAGSRFLRQAVCAATPTFVEGTVRLSGDRLSAAHADALRAPYRRREHRQAIADFVGDVPLRSPHPSEDDLAAVADRLGSLDMPVLLAWGAKDPVFDDDFAADLAGRLPNAQLHRFPTANHLVMVEADVAGTLELWLSDLDGTDASGSRPTVGAAPPDRPLWAAVHEQADSDPGGVALVDLGADASTTWAELAARIDGIAAELRRRGLTAGDRVGMLTPPSVEQIALMYAVWRAGGVTVLADRGLGMRGLGRAVRSARVRWTIGPRRVGAVARVLRWAPRATHLDVGELIHAGDTGGGTPPEQPGAEDLAAVLFTSGATGPAKGVRYTHGQLAAQRDALTATYSITTADRLVAAFAPFALYAPALGIPTALPDCDVTAPGSLTASALRAAVERVQASLVFASPAALANVTATRSGVPPLGSVRTLMSAGAPVPSELLRDLSSLVPDATLHTPYGMTEVLPVADVDLELIELGEAATPAAGVCVGHPVEGAEVRVVPLDFDASAGVPDALAAGETGELLVRAPWRSEGYLGLWATQRRARPGDGWHRTGDVGHLDPEGRLWVEGRAVHVIHGVDGPVTSVPVERAVEMAGVSGVRPGRVAAVGVGPVGLQQLVIVVETESSRLELADRDLSAAIRAAVDEPVAAVLAMPKMPVDIRHNAKIDRAALAASAARLLAGGQGR